MNDLTTAACTCWRHHGKRTGRPPTTAFRWHFGNDDI